MDVSPPSESVPLGETTQATQQPSESVATEEEETSPERTGPPSEASSQDWDKLTDPGATS